MLVGRLVCMDMPTLVAMPTLPGAVDILAMPMPGAGAGAAAMPMVFIASGPIAAPMVSIAAGVDGLLGDGEADATLLRDGDAEAGLLGEGDAEAGLLGDGEADALLLADAGAAAGLLGDGERLADPGRQDAEGVELEAGDAWVLSNPAATTRAANRRDVLIIVQGKEGVCGFVMLARVRRGTSSW